MHAAPDGAGSDLFVLNTCSVTEHSGTKSRHALRHQQRLNPNAEMLVTGCYAESDRERVEEIEGVTRAFGNKEKQGLVPWVARELLGMEGELPEMPKGISEFAGHTRAFVKIQDGCRDHCTFCIIPALRGDVQSRGEEEIIEELLRLVDSGYKEVVFTGIHLGYYGFDRQDPEAMMRLLRRTREIPGLRHAKLSSVEVHEISDELIDLFAESPDFFLPHFHLPLQAGCDATLKRMRRRYNVDRFRRSVAQLRERLDRPAITTDVIVGFPGESRGDFEDSYRFCEEMNFAKMHIFPYSVRRGTLAETMPDHVPHEVLAQNKRLLADLDDAMASEFRELWVGSEVPALIEGRRNPQTGQLTGLSDRFVRVDFDGGDELMNEIIPIRVKNNGVDRVLGQRVLRT